MGWNQLQTKSASRLLEGIAPDAHFYFAHSYAAQTATAILPPRFAPHVYTGMNLSPWPRKKYLRVQFHPEKSGDAGQRVLQKFSCGSPH